MTISILGCGWLGLPLLSSLAEAGHHVRGTSRNPDTLRAITAGGGEAFDLTLPGEVPATFLAATDVLIITLPPRGRALGDAATENYLQCLRSFETWLNEADSDRRVIFCSSTGVYGEATGVLTETAPLAPDTASGRAVAAAEDWLQQQTTPPTILRLAGLAGPGRHPGRFYGGRDRPIPEADAPVNLVHRDDVISAIHLLLRREDAATYNVCAAAHPTKGEFYTAAAASLGLEIAGALPGGAAGKRIDSARLRALSWHPVWDNLEISFLEV